MPSPGSGTSEIPYPSGEERQNRSHFRRQQANNIALKRPSPINTGRDPATENNGEETLYDDHFSTNFTKGLPHDEFGFVNPGAYRLLVKAINNESDVLPGDMSYFDKTVPSGGTGSFKSALQNEGKTPVTPIWRNWESPRAGHVYDLQGPDADAVCMPPAPRLASAEMAVEMAEIYAMALLRDAPFSEIEDGTAKAAGTDAKTLITDIAKMDWFKQTYFTSVSEMKRRDARRLTTGNAAKKCKAAFRGSTNGAHEGPYISQFLLVGTKGVAGRSKPDEGKIGYGTQVINQRNEVHKAGMDYMTEWEAWLDVQNGINMKTAQEGTIQIDQYEDDPRFIMTPRDLATYVHFDALYQAYLNACLVMLGNNVRFSRGFPSGVEGVDETRGSFATFGPPHILALLTEVSTRALRAVRRQKFNYHRRCRPEQIGGLLTLAANGAASGQWLAEHDAKSLRSALPEKLREAVITRNSELDAAKADRWVQAPANPGWMSENLLLPMAFPEGSPMHPAYGAGHATVAGACVTVLKAFFDMYEGSLGSDDEWTQRTYKAVLGKPHKPAKIYEADPECDGAELCEWQATAKEAQKVTLQGELDKLAANISIGRNMAGVHFYTDYYDSVRMGERIAVGILQEQMTNYPEKVTMRFHDFDGNRVMIQGRNVNDPVVMISRAQTGPFTEADENWWLCEPQQSRHHIPVG